MRPTLLSEKEIDLALADLPAWRRTGPVASKHDALTREFRFADFRAAFTFMCHVATEAERLDHHPDWSNSYSRVEISLCTHDAGGITALDLELARFCDETFTAPLAVNPH